MQFFLKPIPFMVNEKGNWAYGVVAPNPRGGFYLTMTTSFGNFGYIWSAPGDDHMGFLKSLSRDYAMGKLTDGKTEQFDSEATQKHLLSKIKDIYGRNADDSRCARRDVNEFFNVTYRTQNEFQIAAMNQLSPFPFREYEDLVGVTVFDIGLSHFWEKLWPLVLVEIEKQVDA